MILNAITNYFNTLFILLLVLIKGWSYNLLPLSYINFISRNRIVQLIIFYVVILFTIDDINSYDHNILIVLLEALLILFMYILFTKQELIYIIIITSILVIQQFLYNRLDYKLKLKETDLSEEETIKIDNYIKIYSIINIVLLVLCSLIGVYGVTTYFIKQYKSHRKKSRNIFEFILKFLIEGNKTQQKSYKKII